MKTREEATAELKEKIVALMWEFTDEYAAPDSELHPEAGRMLVDVLTSCLSEAQYQVANYHPYTVKQVDHICYTIGNWYLQAKGTFSGAHNLGLLKEHLKVMICGIGTGR
jgi:hypothetical protein